MRCATATVDRLAARCAAGRRRTRILVLPAYPQYSATTTASVIDAVTAWSARMRNLPELRFVNRYHDDRGYIEALARADRSATGGTRARRPPGHELPRRAGAHAAAGRPYHCECQKTARLLAARAGARRRTGTRVTFQSRFGKAEWLEPYTEPTLRELAQAGVAGSTWSAPASPATAWRRWRKSRMEGRAGLPDVGRQGVPLHPLPERRAGLDRGARANRRAAPGRLADPRGAGCRRRWPPRGAAVAMGAKRSRRAGRHAARARAAR